MKRIFKKAMLLCLTVCILLSAVSCKISVTVEPLWTTTEDETTNELTSLLETTLNQITPEGTTPAEETTTSPEGTTTPEETTTDTFVIAIEQPDGMFNPFFATNGNDKAIVSMTQIGMFATDENGNSVCGEDEACVVLDYEAVTEKDAAGNIVYTTYYFVIKNGIDRKSTRLNSSHVT